MDNKFAVPTSIIVAGIIIAGAVFYVNRSGGDTQQPEDGHGVNGDEIALQEISEDDHILGSPNAKLTIVEFSDIDCPFCAQFHKTMVRVIDDYGAGGEVAWVYRHFPLAQLHPAAPTKAEASECVAELGGNQAFWDYLDILFERTDETVGDLASIASEVGVDDTAFGECMESEKHRDIVREQFEEARGAGGSGTPYSVLVSKDPFPAEMEKFVNDLLIQTGIRPQSLRLGPDGHTLVVGGAFDYEIMKAIVQAALL